MVVRIVKCSKNGEHSKNDDAVCQRQQRLILLRAVNDSCMRGVVLVGNGSLRRPEKKITPTITKSCAYP